MAGPERDERERRIRERRREGDTTMMTWLLGFIAGLVVLGLMASAYVIGFNRGQDDAREEALARQPAATQPAATQPTEPEPAGPGLELFAQNCGSCHALEAAGSSGTIGPDLDTLAPDRAQVIAAIENGGTGSGAMPANIVSGADAQQVAEFVATSAGG